MKILLFFPVFLLLFSFTIADPITEKERSDLLSYRASAQATLLNAVKGLSTEQLNWKPNDSAWSVANCVEHITIVEKSIFEWAMGTLKEAADPAKRSEIKTTDEQVKAMIESREKKAKAPEQIQPKGQLGDFEKVLTIFEKQSSDLSKYIQTTKDDLRNHFAKTPVGTVDTYQLLLFLTAHTKRHTAQLLEVKAMKDFPKK